MVWIKEGVMIYIEVPDMNDSVSRITLSRKEYYIRFTYNPSYDYWSFGLYNMKMEPIKELGGMTLKKRKHDFSISRMTSWRDST